MWAFNLAGHEHVYWYSRNCTEIDVLMALILGDKWEWKENKEVLFQPNRWYFCNKE